MDAKEQAQVEAIKAVVGDGARPYIRGNMWYCKVGDTSYGPAYSPLGAFRAAAFSVPNLRPAYTRAVARIEEANK